MDLPGFWRRFPVSSGLAWAILVFFLAEVVLGGLGREESAQAALTRLGSVRRDLVLDQGDPWRLFTAPFLHLGVVHLLLNLLAFVLLAPLVEHVYGHWRLLAVYLASAVGGTLCSILFLPEDSVGASGAILGLAGLLLGTTWFGRDPWRADLKRALGTSLLVGVALTFVLGIGLQVAGHRIIDNPGHLGGLLTGILASLLFPRPERREGLVVELLAGVLLGLLIAAIAWMLLVGPRAAERAEEDLTAALVAEVRRAPRSRLAARVLPWVAHQLIDVERDADADWATYTWCELSPEDPLAQAARARFLVLRPEREKRDPQAALPLAQAASAALESSGPRAALAGALDTEALVLRALGRDTDAYAREERVIELCEALLADPGSGLWARSRVLAPEQLLALLHEVWRRRGDTSRARAILERWAEAAPDDPLMVRARAATLLGLAGPDQASLALEEARKAENLAAEAFGLKSQRARRQRARARDLQSQALTRLGRTAEAAQLEAGTVVLLSTNLLGPEEARDRQRRIVALQAGQTPEFPR